MNTENEPTHEDIATLLRSKKFKHEYTSKNDRGCRCLMSGDRFFLQDKLCLYCAKEASKMNVKCRFYGLKAFFK